jgi:hypothetical protein
MMINMAVKWLIEIQTRPYRTSYTEYISSLGVLLGGYTTLDPDSELIRVHGYPNGLYVVFHVASSDIAYGSQENALKEENPASSSPNPESD